MRFFLSALFITAITFSWAQSSMLKSAYAHYQEGDYKTALEEINEATAHKTTADKTKTWLYRGQIMQVIYLKVKQDQSLESSYGISGTDALLEALHSFERVKELDGGKNTEDLKLAETNRKRLADVFYQEGVEQYNAQEFGIAGSHFDKCVGIKADFEIVDSLAMYNAALSYDRAGDAENATLNYEKCIRLDFKKKECYAALIWVLINARKQTKALKYAEEAYKLYPENPEVLLGYYNALAALERYPEAVKILDEVIVNDPENKMLYFNRGTCYQNMDDAENAVTDFEKAIELDPEYFNALYNLGAIYYNLGADVFNESGGEEGRTEEEKEQIREYFNKALEVLNRAHEVDLHNKSVVRSIEELSWRLKELDEE